MEYGKVLEKICDTGVLAELCGTASADAGALAATVQRSGVSAVAVSMAEPGAEQIVAAVRQACPDLLVGVCDVIDAEQCRLASAQGAAFAVSMGLDAEMLAWCGEHGMPLVPNCVTPGEMAAAYRLGLRLLAFYPGRAYGGADTLKCVEKSLPGTQFLLMGEEDPAEIDDYAALACFGAAGCRWLAKTGLDAAAIEANAKAAVLRVLGFEMFHIGVNSKDAAAALETARQLNDAFGLPMAEGPGGYYVSRGLERIEQILIDPSGNVAPTDPGAFYVTADFEIMKKQGLGTNGHFAIRTNSVERALVYLKKRGYEVDMGTAYHMAGRYFTVYLADEFGGFAAHLFQK